MEHSCLSVPLHLCRATFSLCLGLLVKVQMRCVSFDQMTPSFQTILIELWFSSEVARVISEVTVVF